MLAAPETLDITLMLRDNAHEQKLADGFLLVFFLLRALLLESLAPEVLHAL